MRFFRTSLLCGVLWLLINYGGCSSSSQSCGPSTGPPTTATDTSPVAKRLTEDVKGATKFRCSADTDCRNNHFCDGRKMECVKCYDCANDQRTSKIGFDGAACAHHQYECGACISGYTEAGRTCRSKDLILEEGNRLNGDFSFQQDTNVQEEIRADSAKSTTACSLMILLVYSGVTILLIGLGFGVLTGKVKWPIIGGTQQSDEEQALMSAININNLLNQPAGSALLDESMQQRPRQVNNMQQATNAVVHQPSVSPPALPNDRESESAVSHIQISNNFSWQNHAETPSSSLRMTEVAVSNSSTPMRIDDTVLSFDYFPLNFDVSRDNRVETGDEMYRNVPSGNGVRDQDQDHDLAEMEDGSMYDE